MRPATCSEKHGDDRANPWGRLLTALLAGLLAGLAHPEVAGAQPRPVVLTVHLLTVAREPVPQVEVRVIDAASDQRLAAGTTDGKGQVRFGGMPPTDVRVRLTGTLPDGTPLRHTRQDQRGIWVNLPAHDWLMDLRADVDGLVFPDLGLGNAGAPDAEVATALAAGALPPVYPTALVATTVPQSTPRLQVAQVSTAVPETAVSQAVAAPTTDVPGIAMLVALVGLIGGVVWGITRTSR